MFENIDFMVILPVIFVSGFVVFLKCEKRSLKIVALIVSLFACSFWIVLEELSTIKASLSFNKIAEHNKAPMALFRDDDALTMTYLNKEARELYNYSHKQYKRVREKVGAKELIRNLWRNRSLEQIRKSAEAMRKECDDEELKRKLKKAKEEDADEDEFKRIYIEFIADCKLEQYNMAIERIRIKDAEDSNEAKDDEEEEENVTPITLSANLVTDEAREGAKDKFIITQLTAIPIKQDGRLISKFIDWLGINVKGEEDKQYLGFLMTVMTLDLGRCEKDTKQKIRERLKPTPPPITMPTPKPDN